MSGRRVVIFVLLILGLILFGPRDRAATQSPAPGERQDVPVAFTFQRANQILLEGSSTVTDWTCRSTTAGGFIQFPVTEEAYRNVYERARERNIDQARSRMLEALRSRPRALVWIPIKSFTCDNERMTRDMYEALKVHEQRIILFQYNHVDRVRVNEFSDGDPLSLRLAVTGGLALARVGKTMQTQLTVRSRGRDQYELSGTLKIRMSDFKIQRPTALLGLIKAYDPVTVRYRLVVEKIQSPPQAERYVQENLQKYMKLVQGDTKTPDLLSSQQSE